MHKYLEDDLKLIYKAITDDHRQTYDLNKKSRISAEFVDCVGNKKAMDKIWEILGVPKSTEIQQESNL